MAQEEKPAEQKAAQKKKKGKVDLTKRVGLRGSLPTDTETRTFLAREVKGRDGSGPCKVSPKGPVLMPNGDVANEGDTFDPEVEGMSVSRLHGLSRRSYVEVPKGMLNKLLKTDIEKKDEEEEE